MKRSTYYFAFAGKKPLMLVLSALFASSLSGCGGGSGGATEDPSQPIQPINPVVSKQVIGTIQTVDTQANQITINQTTYPLEGVEVSYQTQSLDASALAFGMPVIFDTQSNKLQLNPNISGMVQNLQKGSNAVTFTVNQINLTASQDMLSSLMDIENGDTMLVHFTPQVNGSNHVESLIEIESEGFNGYEIEGLITAVDLVKKQLILGNTPVNYRTATVEDGVIAAGRFAEIFGNFAANGSGVFQAQTIDIETTETLADSVEFEGTISWVNQEQTLFELNSRYQIAVNANTRFEDGNASNLLVGQVVEVDTQLQQDVRVATKVDFETTFITDPDSAKTQTNTAFQVQGVMSYTNSRLTFNGFEFVVEPTTQLDDGLTLQTLNNQNLQLEGVERAEIYYVREIEKADNDFEIELEGIVQNGMLWGYSSSDQSLNAFEGQTVELECRLESVNQVSLCQRD